MQIALIGLLAAYGVKIRLPKTFLTLAIIYVNLKGLHGLRCLSCSAVVSPTECDTVKLCGPHEICVVEASVSDSGLVRYHLGCRDSQQCSQLNGKRQVLTNSSLQTNVENTTKNHSGLIDHPTFANHRLSRSLLVCSECCASTLCNSAGCGHTGYRPHHGPVCFNCPLQQSPDDCDVITVCGQDQTCMFTRTFSTVTHLDIYETKCEDKTTCRKAESISIIGKRQIVGGKCGTYCCNADVCNLGCSAPTAPSGFSVTLPLPITVPDPCTANPCVRGTCLATLQSYVCICETDYTGQNCDQHVSTITTSTTATTTTTARPTTTMTTTVRPTTTMTTTVRPTTTKITTTTTVRPTTTMTTTIRQVFCPEGCPHNWDLIELRCYCLFNYFKRTWDDAQKHCENIHYGGHLATINTAEVDKRLLHFADQNRENYWVGGTLMDTGRYGWVTGEPMTYQHWIDGEPHNRDLMETCIDLRYANGKLGWNNENCVFLQFYICENPSILLVG